MIGKDSIAEIEFSMNWKSSDVSHRDVIFRKINFWRDCMPHDLDERLIGASAGDLIRIEFRAGEFAPVFDQRGEIRLSRKQVDEKRVRQIKSGRFYPKGIINGMTGIFPENIEPFRCIGLDDDSITADFNHPMSGRDVGLDIKIMDVTPVAPTLGGECSVLSELLTSAGPGMQARWRRQPTVFLTGEKDFERQDEDDDSSFYGGPRFVMHVDTHAASMVSALYSDNINKGADILDLMSGWRSHIPEDLKPSSVTGLGMNMEEMLDNPALTERIVHDLNRNPVLPFPDSSFDAVLCAMSVEYLVDPESVFREVSRVLKPGGKFIVSFSNRWFPPKAVRIWSELHEFERIGLVTEYFLESDLYSNIQTFSLRGYPRPWDDRYFPLYRLSDPVYAVIGEKVSQ